MWLHSEIVPGVNGSIKGRGVNLRHLTTTQRVALAASARMGKLNVCDLSAPQASTLFGAPVVDVDREIARRRSSELSDAAAYFASVWLATDPAARAEAIRSIGVDLFRAALAEVIT